VTFPSYCYRHAIVAILFMLSEAITVSRDQSPGLFASLRKVSRKTCTLLSYCMLQQAKLRTHYYVSLSSLKPSCIDLVLNYYAEKCRLPLCMLLYSSRSGLSEGRKSFWLSRLLTLSLAAALLTCRATFTVLPMPVARVMCSFLTSRSCSKYLVFR